MICMYNIFKFNKIYQKFNNLGYTKFKLNKNTSKNVVNK